MSYLNLPNPCLSAILLTVSTHSGPQFVFNYPPVPTTIDTSLLKDRESELLSDSESDSNWSYASDEENLADEEVIDDSDVISVDRSTAPEPQYRGMPGSLLERLERPRRSINKRHHGSVSGPTSRRSSHGSIGKKKPASKKFTNGNASGIGSGSGGGSGGGSGSTNPDDQDVTKVAGFDTDFLSELLCPQRIMCNMRFEMCVDDTVFLGLPIHIHADGQWRKKKSNRKVSYSVQSTLVGKGNKRKSASDIMNEGDKSGSGSDISNNEMEKDNEDNETTTGNKGNNDRYNDRLDNDKRNTLPSREDLSSSISSLPEFSDPLSPMRMFHVVFVMTPPITEYKYRVDEMYHFVLTNFVKTLRTEQAKSNYVWKEVSAILKIRDSMLSNEKLPSPYQLNDAILKSSSLAVAISQLYNAIDASEIANIKINNKLKSFQIPIEYEFQRLPAITEPYLSRSYLTSISDFNNSDNSSPQFNVYSAILLLDSPDRIIKDIGVDNVIANLIKDINPTVTIQTLANTSGIDVNQIIELMNSLIYWRKARPIAPLNHRNIYAVSPLASIGQIYKYITMFKEQFPSLPSLPRMLSMLSTGKPRSFAYHIPSKDHRDVYLSALAWLFKYGFVMQLRTFVWLRVTKKIKMAVNRDMQNEEQLREVKRQLNDVNSNGTNEDPNSSQNETKNTDTSTDNTSKRDAAAAAVAITITDPTPASSSQNLDQLPNVPASSTNFFPSSSHSSELSDLSTYNEDWKQDTILLDPTTATLLQKKWIAKIAENKTPEQTALFNRLVKYFDGHSPMENVMLIEYLPRQELRKLINAFDEYLIIVRHW